MGKLRDPVVPVTNVFPVESMAISRPCSAPTSPMYVEYISFEPFVLSLKMKTSVPPLCDVSYEPGVVGKSEDSVLPTTHALPLESKTTSGLKS